MASKDIAVIMAMALEAEPVIERLKMDELDSVFGSALPMKAYEGKTGDTTVALVTHGQDARHGVDNVGSQPATVAALLAIQSFHPKLVVNAGTAGGMKAKGARIGDVYLGQGSLSFHDRRIPIPGYWEYGIGAYPVPDGSRIAAELGLKTGAVSTGNSLDMTARDAELIDLNRATIKDMEAAAIAWVASLYEIPLVVLKSVTDLVDGDKATPEEFSANFKSAVSNLCSALVGLLAYVSREPGVIS